MKCPQCGDDMVDGRCRFCGYRPTEADRQAYARWAEQKKQAERGFPGPEPERKAARPERTAKQAGAAKPAAKRPAKKSAATAATKPPADGTGPPRRKSRKAAGKPARARDGPGLLGRLVPRLVVIAWALLLAYLMVSELAAGMPP